MFEKPLITAVIPVRLSADRLYDEPERIARIIATLPQGYAPLIVDYGTPAERAGELRDLAAATGTRLVRVETGDAPFSVGHARDIGTQHAQTPLILYHDIDFLMSPRSYERVLEETRLRGMPDNAYTFFALPGAYMTEDFTRRYLDLFARGEAAFADTLLHDGVMRDDRTVYQNHTYAISAIVASRYHLLAIGGHDKSFVGHGAEDFELLHRLASYGPKGPRTGNYYLNTRRNAIQHYEGFRAYFALYGIDVFQRGLQMAHLWHPQREDASYVTPMTENQERVSGIMEAYDTGASWLLPMEDLHSREKTLVLAEEDAPALRALRHAFPAFGHYRIRQEGDFADSDLLIRTLDTEGFTRILFLDPYGNDHRCSLYKGLKAAGRRLAVWGQGGLPGSWFFDSEGVCADSASYAVVRWDKPLDEAARQRVLDWLECQKPTLAEDTEAAGPALAERLGLGGRRMVLVDMQDLDDGMARAFAGPCGGADAFKDWIAHLAEVLDPQAYLVVAKSAPGAASPDMAHVLFVDENEEAADLIDLAASVVVLNSGLGLAALAKGKPVICCGEAFYAQPGLACTVSEREALVAAVKEASLPDEDRRLSFLRYLTEDFYSFGVADQVPSSAGGTTNRILFSVIRGLTEAPIALGQVPGNVSLKAPLYFSFGGREGVQEETKAINTFIRMGSAACEKGEYDEALRLFAIANRRQLANKNLSRAMTEAGKVAHAAGERDEAARLFETARRWVPDGRGAARPLIELAKAVRLAGDYEDADRLFEIAYRWLPEDRNLHKLLLETGVQRHGGPLADWMILPAGKLSEKAREAFAAGDYRKATQLFEALRAREPDEVEHLRCLAECYLKRGADALALECLDEALKRLPENKRLQRRRRDAALPQWLRWFFPGRPFLP